MQLSPRTLAILKNFAILNPAIIFQPGNVIRTMTTENDLLANGLVGDNFEKKFAISDLSQFLAVLSSFENPTLTFKDKFLLISQESRKVQYTYGEESFIKAPPEKEISLPTKITQFKLPETYLKNLNRISNILRFPNIAVEGKDGNLTIQGLDVKNNTGNVYTDTLGKSSRNFKMVFNSDRINNLMLMDYDVLVTEGVIKFTGSDLTYWLAPQERYSTYDK